MQMTYDPNQASEVLKSFTFRDVVQGRVAIEENLDDSDSQPHENKSAVTTAQGHAPATPLNDSFIFLLKAGNVQPARGELHFTIFPHHQMHHGQSGSNKEESADHKHTTHLPAHNRTTSAGRGVRRGDSTTQSKVRVGVTPHVLAPKNKNRTQHKMRNHSRWGNHTRIGGSSEIDSEGAGGGQRHALQPQTTSISYTLDSANPPDTQPVYVEVLPRPSSDPLLIILPLLACLLLVVILIVLILMFRRRKEKQARLRLLQQLAAVTLPAKGGPYLGQAEQSAAFPTVVVTPLSPSSCPTSPRLPVGPRRMSLAPGMTFWGPMDTEEPGNEGTSTGCDTRKRDGMSSGTAVQAVPAVSAGFKSSLGSKSTTPILKHYQYWV